MKIDVLYQFNENYAPFAGVSITSLFMNNQEFDRVRVFILGEELSGESVNKLEHLAMQYNRQIIFIDTSDLIKKMKSIGLPTYRGSYAANMRLFLSDVLPDDVDKLIYLDADTIVNKSLKAMLDINMKGFALGMVLDSLADYHKFEIGLSKQDNYYNSGVILFQLKEWNRQKLSEKIVNHINTVRAHYPSPDQDLLNVVCREQIKLLPPKYNLQPIHLAFINKNYYRYYRNKNYYSSEEVERAKNQVVIYHFFRFIGEFPWDEGNLHPCSETFDYYLKMSEWKDYNKKKSKLANIIKIEKQLYSLLPQFIFIGIFKMAHRFFIWKSNKMSLKEKNNKIM